MIPHVPYARRNHIPEAPAPAPVSSPSQVDLHSQLEELLDSVWRAEADWRFNDRIDLALKHHR
jgi:hypothetical protein